MLYTKEEIENAIVQMNRSYDLVTEEFLEKNSYEKIHSWLSATWDKMYDYIDKNVRRTIKKLLKQGYFFSKILVRRAIMELEEEYSDNSDIKIPTLPETYRERFFTFEFNKLLDDRYFFTIEERYGIKMQLQYEQEMEKKICDSYVNNIKDSWLLRMKDFSVN